MSNPDEKTGARAVRQGRQVLRRRHGPRDAPRAADARATARSRASARSTGWSSAGRCSTSKPDPWLVERHEREIFPLLHRRAWFAEASDFLLYDLVTRSGGRRRGRAGVLERLGSPAFAGHLSHAVRLDQRHDPDVRRVRASRAAMGRSGWSGGRSRRASGCPTIPARSSAFRDARTGLEYLRSSKRALGARSRRLARRLRDQRLLGVPRHLGRCRRAVGATRLPSWRRRRPVTRRCAARAPAGADPRAVPGDLRRRADGRGPRRGRDLGAAGRARAAGRRVPLGGRRGDRGGRRPGRHREAGPATGAAGLRRDGRSQPRTPVSRLPALLRDPDPAAEPDDEDAPERRHGLGRRDRATLLAWLTLSPAGELAPGADVAATSLAWYDELRVPGALVAGLHDMGFGEGEAWAITDDVRVLLAVPRPSGMRGSARVVAARLLERVAGERRDACRDRAQHVGRRRVPRSRPAARPPVVGRPPRHDRRAGRPGGGGQRPGCGAPGGGRRGGRLPGRPVARRTRRRLHGRPSPRRPERRRKAPTAAKAPKRRTSGRSLSEKDPPQE